MKSFNRSGGSGGRKRDSGFGRRYARDRDTDRAGRNSFGRAMMFKAVCAQCGDGCEVPFKPSGGRPVLCSNCFKGKDDQSPKRFSGKGFDRPRFGVKRAFRAICDKCGQSCEVPFQPTEGKPVYCSECFGKSNKSEHGSNDRGESNCDNFKEQLEILNAKLDKILRVIAFVAPSDPVVKKEVAKEVKNIEVIAMPIKPSKKKASKKTTVKEKK